MGRLQAEGRLFPAGSQFRHSTFRGLDKTIREQHIVGKRLSFLDSPGLRLDLPMDVNCPHCEICYPVDDDLFGSIITCRSCNRRIEAVPRGLLVPLVSLDDILDGPPLSDRPSRLSGLPSCPKCGKGEFDSASVLASWEMAAHVDAQLRQAEQAISAWVSKMEESLKDWVTTHTVRIDAWSATERDKLGAWSAAENADVTARLTKVSQRAEQVYMAKNSPPPGHPDPLKAICDNIEKARRYGVRVAAARRSAWLLFHQEELEKRRSQLADIVDAQKGWLSRESATLRQLLHAHATMLRDSARERVTSAIGGPENHIKLVYCVACGTVVGATSPYPHLALERLSQDITDLRRLVESIGGAVHAIQQAMLATAKAADQAQRMQTMQAGLAALDRMM